MNVLLPPVLMLGGLLIIGYASLFHIWQGRDLRDLGIFLLAASIGFVAGQLVGNLTQLPWFEIGRLHTFEASVGAWLALFGVRIVAQPRPEGSNRKTG